MGGFVGTEELEGVACGLVVRDGVRRVCRHVWVGLE